MGKLFCKLEEIQKIHSEHQLKTGNESTFHVSEVTVCIPFLLDLLQNVTEKKLRKEGVIFWDFVNTGK